MPDIHPTAVVSPQARLGRDVSIGPFCVVERDVTIGRGCQLAARVVVKRGTHLGADNEICEGAVLGGRPQHLHAGREVGRLRIGKGNLVRENVTIHVGLTPTDTTWVGDGNLIMVNAHVAHDCQIGHRTILANNVMLAGHIEIQDYAYLSGAVAVHQFCRIGQYAMVGGQAHIKQDVPPFVTVDGYSSQIVGLNLIGLRRHGMPDEEVKQLKRAYRLIYRSGLKWEDVLTALRADFQAGPPAEFYRFFTQGRRGFLQPRRLARAAAVRLTEPQSEYQPYRAEAA